MFLFLSPGHLALQSRTQRMMPGILPSATRIECSPRACCQVVLAGCFLGAEWPLEERVGLSPEHMLVEHSEARADGGRRLRILTLASVLKPFLLTHYFCFIVQLW